MNAKRYNYNENMISLKQLWKLINALVDDRCFHYILNRLTVSVIHSCKLRIIKPKGYRTVSSTITVLRCQVFDFLWTFFHYMFSKGKDWRQYFECFQEGLLFVLNILAVQKEVRSSFGNFATIADRVPWILKIMTKFICTEVA